MLDDHTLTLVLLSVIAPVGAIDALYFHVWTFRLAERPESRLETLTHIARSVVLGIVALTLALYEPRGAWFFAIAALLVLDFGNNLVDAALEGDSRKDLGGLPPLDYAIHIAGATWVGAASLAYVVIGLPTATAATELAPAALPGWLVANAAVIGVGAFALATLEAGLMCSAVCRPERLGAT